jgi:dTDP-4-amino-4,6-dideoxygalactose transaminase
MSACAFSLPFFVGMTNSDVARVVEALAEAAGL